MEFDQLLLGFDAREMWIDFPAYWSEERQADFLLRQDVEKPLSADTMVWASLFRSNKTVISHYHQTIVTGSVADLPIPIEYRSIDNLWLDLEAMRSYLGTVQGFEAKPYWLIAIAEVMDSQYKDEEITASSCKPVEVDDGWQLLGFDVAHDYLTSALSNARYESDEIEALKMRWSSLLNSYHLFSNVAEADRFADWADKRDTGHAPHFVYALYLVDKH